MNQKICFVIMGFGKKTDLSTSDTFDLDKTYLNIIRPAVINSGFTCVRADEIKDSGIIDRSMYALLMQADLVIADISTYNPNAIYELGIRHASKPFSTIILKEKGLGKIPFDLDHTRMFTYTHLGEDIGYDEAIRCVKELSQLITSVTSNRNIDSPLYEYMNTVTPPILPMEEYQNIIGELAEKEKNIFAIVDKAKEFVSKSDFISAHKFWEKAVNLVPNEIYFTQQLALSRYKSKIPSEHTALTDALGIINNLLPSNDPETLGIAGAINKGIFQLTKDVQFLNRAIENYERGFKLSDNYYTGENYALCLNLLAEIVNDSEEKIALKFEAKKSRMKIIKILEEIMESEEFLKRDDKKWIYATISHCCFFTNDSRAYEFELKFIEDSVEWEKETFNKSKNLLLELNII